jgi:AraC-like DNA-binding protein/mannose-6-phosphate isomerase-like protein (cupin superfamily)
MSRSVAPRPERRTRTAYGLVDVPLRVRHQRLVETVPTHWHEFYEIVYVLAGTGTHRTNGRSVAIGAGSLIGMTPADFHDLDPDPGSPPLEVIDVIFGAELLDDDVQRLLLSRSWPLHLTFARPRDHALRADLLRLCEEESQVRPGGPAASRATLQRVLIDIIRATGVTDLAQAGRPDDHGLRGALLYLHHRFRQPVSLADAAAHAHLSPNYFSGRFRALTGMSFVRYRQELRLQFARSLIAISDLPITEVCYAAGFNTLSHFERAFHARWGCAPRTVRTEGGTAPNGDAESRANSRA